MALAICRDILIALAIAVCLISSLGLLFGDAFDRLHYLGPPTILSPLMIALSVMIHPSSAEALIKAIIVTFIMWLASPTLTHAIAECGYVSLDSSHKED
jgi:monovalent cation/proton antiporter MnhG/PhaG subunit